MMQEKKKTGAPRPGKRRFDRNAPRMRQTRDRIVTRAERAETTHTGLDEATLSQLPKRAKLKVIPLGGLGEIGKNMMVLEYDDPHAPNGGDIIIVDLGFAFPESDMHGIDYLLPDITYLRDRINKIRGVILTHGHEDHIGGIPHILPDLNAPLFGTQLTIGLVQKKIKEYPILESANLQVIDPNETLYLGVFKIQPFRVTHSIPDAIGYAIHTPYGVIVHTGDFRLDPTPIDGRTTELEKLQDICEQAGGALMLMSDSTNCEYQGSTFSEKVIGQSFMHVFDEAPGRIIVASFASQFDRIQQVLWSAHEKGRKVALAGRSLIENFEVAMKLGYLKVPDGVVVNLRDVKKYKDHELVVMSTGSQAQPASALARMSTGEHNQVQIKPSDTVVLSASPIPGNEEPIVRMLDDLLRLGARVIYHRTMSVHISGHGFQDELITMIRTCRPKYFVPVHGEFHHLVLHRELAMKQGVPFDHCFVIENGSVIEVDEEGAKLSDKKVPFGMVIVDGSGVGDIGTIVLRDRQAMALAGIFVVIITVDRKNGRMLTSPDIISRGFVYMREADELISGAREEIKYIVKHYGQRENSNWKNVKDILKDEISEYLYKHTKRRPMVIPVIIEI